MKEIVTELSSSLDVAGMDGQTTLTRRRSPLFLPSGRSALLFFVS